MSIKMNQMKNSKELVLIVSLTLVLLFQNCSQTGFAPNDTLNQTMASSNETSNVSGYLGKAYLTEVSSLESNASKPIRFVGVKAPKIIEGHRAVTYFTLQFENLV